MNSWNHWAIDNNPNVSSFDFDLQQKKIFTPLNHNLLYKQQRSTEIENLNRVSVHFWFITEWWKWILFFVNISKKEKSKVIRATAFLIISLLYNTFGPKHKARAKSKRNVLTKIFNGSAFQSSLLFYHFVSITYIL